MIIHHITFTYYSIITLVSNLVFAGIYIFTITARIRNEKSMQYHPGVDHPFFYFLFIPFIFVIYWVKGTMLPISSILVSFAFNGFLFICFSMLIFLLLGNRIKTRYNYSTYLMLWSLPDAIVIFYNYFAVYLTTPINSAPLLIIKIKSSYGLVLLLLWIVPALFLVIRKIMEHVLFRRYLLKESSEPNAHIRDICYEIHNTFAPDRIHWNPTDRYCLKISPATKSPISVGFFRRDIIIFLPDRDYSDEQLRMIFRHELQHIYNGDSEFKFMITILSSLLWFLPFFRKCLDQYSAVMELRCDAAVLKDADDEKRRAYADLILNTAADSRGFSSCLSATGESIRYRLKNILNHGSQKRGYVVIIAIVFLLLTTYSQVSIAYGGSPRTLYDHSKDNFTLNYVSYYMENKEIYAKPVPSSIMDLIVNHVESLDLYELTGNYTGEFHAYDDRIDIRKLLGKDHRGNALYPDGNHLVLHGEWFDRSKRQYPSAFNITISDHEIVVSDGVITRNYYTDDEILAEITNGGKN